MSTPEGVGSRSRSVLVANRGEVAVRVMAAAAEAGLDSVAVYSEDDADSLHVARADRAVPLPGIGPAAYLDPDRLVRAASDTGCDALHPGYGLLSEKAELAAACGRHGIVFVGPRADTLAVLGDKWASRELAGRCGVPVLEGALDLAGADRLARQGLPLMVKAVAGGGGRGMRLVRRAPGLHEAWERASAEAQAVFGNGDVYAERLLERARHIEVQVVADTHGAQAVLGDRDCSLQRRHQKLVEMAPAPGLGAGTRTALAEASLTMAEAVGVSSLVTFEFLVEPAGGIWFIEANPRLQVEHTVTEMVTGLDLVRIQLELAYGASLAEVGIPSGVAGVIPRGVAVQVRVSAESMAADGSPRPAAGTVSALEFPGGPGVRVDHGLYVGYRPNPRFDPLLAKLVLHRPDGDLPALLAKAGRAVAQTRLEGIETNRHFLRALLGHPTVAAGEADTGLVERDVSRLLSSARALSEGDSLEPTVPTGPGGALGADLPAGTVPALAPLSGLVAEVLVESGQAVLEAAPLMVIESMKMHHLVRAPVPGVVDRALVEVGQSVSEGQAVLAVVPGEVAGGPDGDEAEEDLEAVRSDLAEVLARHALLLDPARPGAVERRRRSGQRTARENIEDLCDPGSFVEYGGLAIAAQRRRRPVAELIERTPGDGMVTGLATVNADAFGPERARCVVMSYDYTVLAGTQGLQNHRKKDRMFELADRRALPVVIFTEGGGGRPGDTDASGVSGLDVMAFHLFGRLSGRVPLVGITSGRCFAGNAALLGCCDVVIATTGSNIGMGGPAMIEGGGLGVFRPEDVGPMEVQVPNGVVDLPVEDEAEAVQTARRYLSYFQGRLEGWECADQRRLRGVVPENRLQVYDVRSAITIMADTGSVLELRRAFGRGMVTALIRIEGRPLGVVANNPVHLAGAIDADGADKAARFMQLCDAFGLPILFLCDTPGIMVGPEAERTALVRHCARLFVVGASLSTPFFTIILRKAYGLGAQTMAGGSFKVPDLCVAWPTGELGGMGLEGAVRLGYRNELEAVEDPAQRQVLFEEMVQRMYEHGKALNAATHFEIDDVIDPADSRRWVRRALESAEGLAPPPSGKRRPCVDTW